MPSMGIEATRPMGGDAASVEGEGIAALRPDPSMEVVEDAGGTTCSPADSREGEGEMATKATEGANISPKTGGEMEVEAEASQPQIGEEVRERGEDQTSPNGENVNPCVNPAQPPTPVAEPPVEGREEEAAVGEAATRSARPTIREQRIVRGARARRGSSWSAGRRGGRVASAPVEGGVIDLCGSDDDGAEQQPESGQAGIIVGFAGLSMGTREGRPPLPVSGKKRGPPITTGDHVGLAAAKRRMQQLERQELEEQAEREVLELMEAAGQTQSGCAGGGWSVIQPRDHPPW